MDVRMDGRKAIITGGSAGLGKAMAMEFNRSGADVAIVGRRQDALDLAKTEIETAGDGQVVAISADIRLAPDCNRVVGEAEAALGNIDILINNAGIGGTASFINDSRETWEKTFNVCWYGVYYSSVKWISPSSVISYIHNASNSFNFIHYHDFNALFESDVCHTTALASTSKRDYCLVVINTDKTDSSTM